MKTYTLKLRTNNGHTYATYDGETQLSDSDLTTLFGSAGEAYFVFDYGTYTPDTTTGFHVVNSQGNIVMVDTTTSIAEGKNFKGEWDGSGSAFTSFAQLPAYGLDESQLSTLVEKIGEGKIKTLTTADYNWPQSGTKTSFNPALADTGVYIVGETMIIRTSTSSTYAVGTMLILSTNKSGTVPIGCLAVLPASNTGTVEAYTISGGTSWLIRGVLRVEDNLNSNDSYGCLSAKQGKVLNDNIGDLTTLTTTDKTSTVAAINELVTSVGNIETALNAINNGGGN